MFYRVIEKRSIILLCTLNIIFFIIFTFFDILRNMGIFRKVFFIRPLNIYTFIISIFISLILLCLFCFSFKKIIKKRIKQKWKKLFHLCALPIIIFFFIIYSPIYNPYVSVLSWMITDFTGIMLTIIYLMFAFE